MSEPVPLYQVMPHIEGYDRREIVDALRAKEIPTDSTHAPWMVKREDVEAWVTAHPKS